MLRPPNTDSSGTPFPRRFAEHVWRSHAADLEACRDAYGRLMARAEFGCFQGCGWVVDHLVLPEDGGDDTPDNLRPVHFQNSSANVDEPRHPELRSQDVERRI